jgi:hypothetical protein
MEWLREAGGEPASDGDQGRSEKAPPLNSMQAIDGAREAEGEGAAGARTRGRRLGFTGGGGEDEETVMTCVNQARYFRAG